MTKNVIVLGAIAAVLTGGCATGPAKDIDYSRLIGQRIELTGVVSQTRIPQLHGIDVPQLEDHRGRTVKASGIVRQSVVTREEIERLERQAGGAIPHRGPGTYYYLQDVQYEVRP